VDTPRLLNLSARGLDLAVWEWPGAGPPLLFAHATGFHGRCWDYIARRFPSHRRLAVDFRGHGRSSKPAPPYRWPEFAADLAAIAAILDLRAAVAIGHSMGGHSIVAATLQRPAAFSSLLLIDPTIFPPARYAGAPFDASFILRRRAAFHSPEEMFDRFRSRPPFASWHPDVLRDYCRFGLLPEESGRFVLACPPAVEADVYSHSTAPEANLHALIPSIPQPVLVIRAGVVPRPGVFDLNSSPTAPDLAARFPHGRDMLLSGHNHFIPMESPDLVVDAIAGVIAASTSATC